MSDMLTRFETWRVNTKQNTTIIVPYMSTDTNCLAILLYIYLSFGFHFSTRIEDWKLTDENYLRYMVPKRQLHADHGGLALSLRHESAVFAVKKVYPKNLLDQ